MKMKYTEQAVETLDDAGSVIANKNIEIEQLRQRVAELEKERDEEIARNRPLRNLIASLEEQKLHWNKQRDEYREAVSTMDSERSANATLTAELDALKKELAHWKNNHETEVRRARILKERTDMPIERVQAYEQWGKDIAERDKAHQYWQIAEGRCDALMQQRDELLVAQQWQPINTAPKEGLFLVHRKHTAYPIVAHVYKPYGSICDYVFGELLHNVTHWMPLPPAPAIASVKEKQNEN